MPPSQSRFVRYAPKVARFLVTTISDNLPHARRLVHAAPLTANDGGDAGDYTVSVAGATSTTRGVIKLAGQLGGTSDSPDVRGLRIPGGNSGEGPQLLALGAVKDGEALVRTGSSVSSAPLLGTGGGTMSGNIVMGGHKITGLEGGTAPGEAATYDQVSQLASMLNGLDWQDSVLRSDLNAVPTSPAPSVGDRFLIAPGASGSPWGADIGHIAVFKGGTTWAFIVPTKGTTVHVDGGTGGGVDLTYDGTNWVNIGASVDHNSTLNRGGDDAHSQYQLGSAKDQENGYAGLSGGVVNKPVKAIRTVGTDPTTGVNPGEVWVNGPDLRYRNNNGGGGQTETIERQGMKDANDGYAGLSGGIVNKAVKAIRTVSPDPTSGLTPGDVWVNGVDLKYRNNNGGGQTETIERQAMKDTSEGYAGLTGGVVNKPVRAIRAVSPDPTSGLNPGDVWVNGIDLKFRDNGGSPATRTVVPASRQVIPGAGLGGGGDLSADRTIFIAAFSGVLSKELAAADYSFTSDQILTHIAYDAGPNGHILPTAVRLPASGVVDGSLETRVLIVFDDASTALIPNTTNSPVDYDLQALADRITGDLTVGAAKNGRSVQQIKFETRNTTTGSIGPITVGPFRVRGFVFPRGGGNPL